MCQGSDCYVVFLGQLEAFHMRLSVITAIMLLLPGVASADEIFGNWMIFPFPNPAAAELLPDADPDSVFRIGQIIFHYQFDELPADDHPVRDLSTLQPVAEIVKAATPGPALSALVDQQLHIPHTFHLDEVTAENWGNAGFMWRVTYSLIPKQGASTGIPFQYRAVLDGRGNLISPRLAVFDLYFHSPDEGWTSSVLRLPASPPAKDAALDAETIRNRATEKLEEAKRKAKDAGNAALTRMTFRDQKLIRFPVDSNENGSLSYLDVWAVNFRDATKPDRPDEPFTVWVTSDGHTADIQHVDLYFWGNDKPHDKHEPD